MLIFGQAMKHLISVWSVKLIIKYLVRLGTGEEFAFTGSRSTNHFAINYHRTLKLAERGFMGKCQ